MCHVCSIESEDCFHALCCCTLSRALWDAMSEVWTLPNITTVENTGVEWLLHALAPLPDIERSMPLMTLWRAWHIRNEIVHNKAPPPMEVSRRFLTSYLDSIIGLKTELCDDPCKGKSIITYHQTVRTTTTGQVDRWSSPPAG